MYATSVFVPDNTKYFHALSHLNANFKRSRRRAHVRLREFTEMSHVFESYVLVVVAFTVVHVRVRLRLLERHCHFILQQDCISHDVHWTGYYSFFFFTGHI